MNIAILLYYYLKGTQKEDDNEDISLNDFADYYNILSLFIDDDKSFDLMISNVWNPQNVAYGKGWGGRY